MGVYSRMLGSKVTILALAIWSASGSVVVYNDDFWPPLQEQWRCLHQKENHEYIWETNYLINYFENPQGHNLRAYDCPVIDPNDPQWCPADSNGQYYPVDCNCHAYYRCEVHSATDFTPKPCIYKCVPHDLVFDPNTKSCVKEDSAPPGICYNTPPRTTPLVPTTTTQPTEPPTTSTDPPTDPPTTSTSTTGPSDQCTYDGQKLSYPGDCHKYYRCEQQNDGSFKVRVYDCGDWAFDPNQGSCVWPGMDNDLCPEEY